jgi:hypothetical protein
MKAPWAISYAAQPRAWFAGSGFFGAGGVGVGTELSKFELSLIELPIGCVELVESPVLL